MFLFVSQLPNSAGEFSILPDVFWQTEGLLISNAELSVDPSDRALTFGRSEVTTDSASYQQRLLQCDLPRAVY